MSRFTCVNLVYTNFTVNQVHISQIACYLLRIEYFTLMENLSNCEGLEGIVKLCIMR